MLRRCAARALADAGIAPEAAQAFFSGDLNDQIIATGFAARALGAPLVGLYGALLDVRGRTGAGLGARQRRLSGKRPLRRLQPLLYGGAPVPLPSGDGHAAPALGAMDGHGGRAARCSRRGEGRGLHRPPPAHWGASSITRSKTPTTWARPWPPAVESTILAHMEDTGASPDDFDLIATGDLGWIGREILLQLFHERGLPLPPEKLVDCGASLFFQGQDTHAGGSAAACVAAVSCGWLMKRMERGEFKRLLLVGSGAMLSPTSTMQSETIPRHRLCGASGGDVNGRLLGPFQGLRGRRAHLRGGAGAHPDHEADQRPHTRALRHPRLACSSPRLASTSRSSTLPAPARRCRSRALATPWPWAPSRR